MTPEPEEQDDDWDDVPDYDDDDGGDEIEDAIGECGQIPGGGCMLAGTEHCDFECPFRDDMYWCNEHYQQHPLLVRDNGFILWSWCYTETPDGDIWTPVFF